MDKLPSLWIFRKIRLAKPWKIGLFWCAVAFLLLSLASYYSIMIQYSKYRYQNIELVPKNAVGVVLGTSQYAPSGESNVFFEARITAAAKLYHARKVDCLLLSGDNTSPSYNEPIAMQHALLSLGVPAERMYLDFAGVRTLDSIFRLEQIFSLKNFTIVSQPFHNERALFIARKNGANAIAFDAGSIRFSLAPLVYAREIASRMIAYSDVFFDVWPKFRWEKIHIEYDPSVRPIPEKICSPR